MADALSVLAQLVGTRLSAQGARLATAESCTGGMVASLVTDIAGSSAWFERGFVTYSNTSKTSMLDVAEELIAQHGAVSEPVAQAMVAGALVHSEADIAVAITGIAGPGGAVPGKPVGTVCFAFQRRGEAALVSTLHFPGDRAAVRRAASQHALRGIADLVQLP